MYVVSKHCMQFHEATPQFADGACALTVHTSKKWCCLSFVWTFCELEKLQMGACIDLSGRLWQMCNSLAVLSCSLWHAMWCWPHINIYCLLPCWSKTCGLWQAKLHVIQLGLIQCQVPWPFQQSWTHLGCDWTCAHEGNWQDLYKMHMSGSSLFGPAWNRQNLSRTPANTSDTDKEGTQRQQNWRCS